MHIPESSENGKVSLDELLRLKRAERPAPEFWARFEQDLRAKQLAAIIEKRPWWVALRFPQLAASTARWQLHLPVGAVALLTLSFIAVREYRALHLAAPAPSVAITQIASNDLRSDVATELGQRESTALAVASATAVERAHTVVGELTPPTAPLAPAPAPIVTSGASAHAELAVSAEPVKTPVAVAAQDFIIAGNIPAAVGVGELSAVGFAEVAQPAAPELGFDERLELAGLSTNGGDGDRTEVRAIRAKPVSARDVRRASILASWVVADHAVDIDRARSAHGQEVNVASLINERSDPGAGRIGVGGDRLTLKF